MDLITKANGDRAATFSPCSTYRYLLRIGSRSGACVNFLMLNPSTADEMKNDPTVERCCRFAKLWGYSGVSITNLFALRSTDPKALKRVVDPVGELNDAAILETAQRDDLVIAAWGNHGALLGRAKTVADMLAAEDIPIHALRVTKAGQPQHPLYLPYTCKPERFTYVAH